MIVRFEGVKMVEEFVGDNDPPYHQVAISDVVGTHYVLLNRSEPFGSDEDPGIYIEVDDQVYSGYDLISTCGLSHDRMVIRFIEPLGTRTHVEMVEVAFMTKPSPEFIARLRTVFTGRDSCLVIADAGL